MDRSKKVVMKKRRGVSVARRTSGKGRGLGWAVVRSFVCGAGTAGGLLCVLALVFAKTTLPMVLVTPSACCAVAVGAFASGMSMGLALPRWRLLGGIGYGAFYVLCLLLAVLIAGSRPVLGDTNLSLLAALLLGGTAGGAAAALCAPPAQGGR